MKQLNINLPDDLWLKIHTSIEKGQVSRIGTSLWENYFSLTTSNLSLTQAKKELDQASKDLQRAAAKKAMMTSRVFKLEQEFTADQAQQAEEVREQERLKRCKICNRLMEGQYHDAGAVKRRLCKGCYLTSDELKADLQAKKGGVP